MKLTKAQRKILTSLDVRAMAIFDLSDKLGISVNAVLQAGKYLTKNGLIDWLYTDDEMCLNPAGRAALEEQP